MREAALRAFEPNRRNLIHWLSWAVALAIQGGAVLFLRTGRIFEWEAWLARHIQRIPGRYELFDVPNYLTNTIAWEFIPLLLVVVASAWMLGERVGAALLVLTLPLHVLAQWPKAVVDRTRPPADFDGLDGIGGLQSFPSGHAEFVITFWGFVAFLACLRLRSIAARVAVVAATAAAALVVGVGRVAIGRHWPLDILVSYVVGLGLLSGLIWLYYAFCPGDPPPEVEQPSTGGTNLLA
jgi:membrane-associated phospholipid phosphatase